MGRRQKQTIHRDIKVTLKDRKKCLISLIIGKIKIKNYNGLILTDDN